MFVHIPDYVRLDVRNGWKNLFLKMANLQTISQIDIVASIITSFISDEEPLLRCAKNIALQFKPHFTNFHFIPVWAANKLPANKRKYVAQISTDTLPISFHQVKKLRLDDFYKVLQANMLPWNLKTLIFDEDFDHVLHANVLPSTLESLTFGTNFNQPIYSNVLPNSLKSLTFGECFNRELLILPMSLTYLEFGYQFDNNLHGVLPSTLHSLIFKEDIRYELYDDEDTFDRVHSDRDDWIGYWDYKAEYPLRTRFAGILNANTLPKNIKVLVLGNFDTEIEDTYPKQLEHLTFGKDFNQFVNTQELPRTLLSLTFGETFNRPINLHFLPPHLELLTFGDSFNQPMDVHFLPPHLQSLTFGDSFNQEINTQQLPTTLTFLKFGCMFNFSINMLELPKSLQFYEVGKTFQQFTAKQSPIVG